MASVDVQLPENTQRTLEDFRRRVRLVRMAEGGLAGLFGALVSWLVVFFLDRFVDTPVVLRWLLLMVATVGLAVVFPLICHRWIRGTRRLEQVASLLKPKFPGLADQMLSVVELARHANDLGSSSTLARAAIQHVDERIRDRDFSDAVPHPRHRAWAVAVAVPACLAVLGMLLVPAAGWNAVARWLMPWRDIPRYTFTQIEQLPERMVVAQGEPFSLTADLQPTSVWRPESGTATVNRLSPIAAARKEHTYLFSIPPQTQSATLDLRIGDVREQIDVETAARPELQSLQARVLLPSYLQYSGHVTADVRGGVVSLVKGSQAVFEALISRALRDATVQGAPARVQGQSLLVDPVTVSETRTMDLQWTDELGLGPREPFRLKIAALQDEPPSVSCQQEDVQPVILSTDVVAFDVSAHDDFGVRRLGLVWTGSTDPFRSEDEGAGASRLASGNTEITPEDVLPVSPSDDLTATGIATQSGQRKPDADADADADDRPASGEKVVSAGAPEARQLAAVATFCAETDGVRPQKLELRAWAEDFHPERGRVYSPVYVLHVMSPEEHAVWIADELRRWASRADDVYEEELRLHETNRELRQLTAAELVQPEIRQSIEQQAAAEQANAARLGAVSGQGKQLIQQALRNPDMQAGNLETWAAALKQLEEIAGKRMPSIAGLLTEAAARSAAASPSANAPGTAPPAQGPMAGHQRNDTAGKSSEPPPAAPDKPVPQLVDIESGFNQAQDDDPKDKPSSDEADKEQKKPPGSGKFSLPSTVLNGGPPPKKSDEGETQQKPEELDQAVEDQSQLLIEFEKVREDLQRIMDDLENSTFVKRLKAASRRQLEVAADLNRTLFHGFGVDRSSLEERQTQQNQLIADREVEQGRFVDAIQSDLEAWLSRKSDEKFVRVLGEMKQTEVAQNLADLGARVRDNLSGDSISRAEYWADMLDRWGEELVSVPRSGKSSGGSNSGSSLPPAIVLEIMRILDGEIDLREETRSLEQARPAVPADEYAGRALRQSETQADLHDRTLQVLTDVRAIPEGDVKFLKELETLTAAGDAMSDAVTLLRQPQTGPDVIAAETEAIELLLQARRSNPKSSGGSGGATAGVGGNGTTDQAALALYGPGGDARAVVEERGVRQVTGLADDQLPEEFREGLDAFFQAIESN